MHVHTRSDVSLVKMLTLCALWYLAIPVAITLTDTLNITRQRVSTITLIGSHCSFSSSIVGHLTTRDGESSTAYIAWLINSKALRETGCELQENINVGDRSLIIVLCYEN